MSRNLKTYNTTSWDASRSLRLLHNIFQVVKQEKNSFDFALNNLSNLAKHFHNQAIDVNYRNSLTVDQNLELVTLFTNLADCIQFGKDECLKQQQQQTNIIKLQVIQCSTSDFLPVLTYICFTLFTLDQSAADCPLYFDKNKP